MADDWWEGLNNVKVVFWICPDGHSERSYKDPPRETVRWIDGIAHCMTPGCTRTSAPVEP
jgi:hypothetical protein